MLGLSGEVEALPFEFTAFEGCPPLLFFLQIWSISQVLEVATSNRIQCLLLFIFVIFSCLRDYGPLFLFIAAGSVVNPT